MKKIIIPILLVLFGLSFASCSQDNLEIEQKGVVSIDNFYKTDDDAESALVAAYAQFATNIGGFGNAYIYSPYIALFNLCGDDMLAAGNFYGDNDFMAAMNEFRYDSQSPVVQNSYSAFYYAIYYDNLVIDHFAYGESAVKDRCISEARVLRAFCHLMLAIGWDCPPLVDHVLQGSDKPSNYEGGHEALLKWCASECEDAVKYLDERSSTSDKSASVKVTKGFAWSVAGKALLFAGDYAGAKTDLKNVISSGKYALVPGERFIENFHIEGDGNEEKIFETNIFYDAKFGDWGGQIQRSTWMHSNLWTWRTDKFASKPTFLGCDGWGGLGVNRDFALAMLANDGQDSYRRKATFLTPDELLYGLTYASDTKADGSTMSLDEKKVDPKRGLSNTTGLYGNCEYLAYKRIPTKTDMNGRSYSESNFLIMRYAEVLLMYAEACAQTGDSDGLQYLQKVQQRAGSAHVSSSLTLSEVKNEKRYEMWLEGCRFADQVRWGDTASLTNAGKHIPSVYDAYFTKKESTHRLYVEYSEPNADKTVGFVAGKHEHFPFPYSVTSINPNIVQNPEW